MRKVPAYRSPLSTHLGLETRSTMRLGTSYRLWRNIYISTNTVETVSPRLLGISNGNTMIFWLRSLASSVTPDSLTPAELAESKKLVMEDIEHYRIPVYNFPYDIEEDDEDTVEENAELRGLMPFAIVGSEEVVEIGGRKVRARQYPWGVVEVDNPRHSDFLAIRSALLHSHLADLKEITHDFLYENYRTEKL